ACVAAFLAYVLYAYQAISRIQVADVVAQGSNRLQSVFFGFILGALPLTLFARVAVEDRTFLSTAPELPRFNVALKVIFSILIVALSVVLRLNLKFIVLGLSFSIAVAAIGYIGVKTVIR